jgi:Carboxypeptidase regulatory-like domain
VKRGRLLLFGALILTIGTVAVGTSTASPPAKSASGSLAGVVRDISGVPQMGATVEVISEAVRPGAPLDLFTNTQGMFRGQKLSPGFYTVRVTLAGFLPTLEKHVRISSNLTTVVRIQLESMFASLDQLRRAPTAAPVESDDWKWVLRSASATRPVLELMDGDDLAAANVTRESSKPRPPRARVEFTDGARRPGSVSNVPSSPATAFAYDQKLGTGRLLLAGQMSYDPSNAPAGGFATVWLPTGSLGAGPHTAVVIREAKLGPDGPTFHGVRIDQGGAVSLGSNLVFRYGGEYVMVGLRSEASALRPRAELDVRINDDWHGAIIFASQPSGPEPLEQGAGEIGGELTAALNELDAFPALLWHHDHPVLQSGWHEELAAERKVGAKGKLQIAAFHDDNIHAAVFGRGSSLPSADFFQDYFSNGFAYDGGSSSSWGARAALREKLTDEIEWTLLYSFAGALSPLGDADAPLRESFRTVQRQSLGASMTARIPHSGTKVSAGYKWTNGATVSRIDGYGESLYQMDPYLHLGFRQPLPKFMAGRWEAVADCDNLLAQGYVSLNSRDGHVLLVPAFRTFRGGLTLQF